MYYPCSENKGVTAKLICGFVFAYAVCWFSHGAAHLRQIGFKCIGLLNYSGKIYSQRL